MQQKEIKNINNLSFVPTMGSLHKGHESLIRKSVKRSKKTLVSIFVIGLAWSISTGLAGFWRGLPFWVIVIFCLYLLVLDSLKSIKK